MAVDDKLNSRGAIESCMAQCNGFVKIIPALN
jgi:hypothetical protein